MQNPIIFAEILNSNERTILIIAIVIAVLLFILLALIGMAVRAVMRFQAKRADTFMHDATKAHVVQTPKQFRRLGFKKNNRALYRDSLIPFFALILLVIAWVIYCLATACWTENLFEEFGELFFTLDWGAEGVWVKVFGITLLGAFPPVTHTPEFHVEHLFAYISVGLLIVIAVYFFVICQAYLSRMVMIWSRSNTVFEKTLEGYNANEDIKVTPKTPLPPSE